jgi:hypothetical protein
MFAFNAAPGLNSVQSAAQAPPAEAPLDSANFFLALMQQQQQQQQQSHAQTGMGASAFLAMGMSMPNLRNSTAQPNVLASMANMSPAIQMLIAQNAAWLYSQAALTPGAAGVFTQPVQGFLPGAVATGPAGMPSFGTHASLTNGHNVNLAPKQVSLMRAWLLYFHKCTTSLTALQEVV